MGIIPDEKLERFKEMNRLAKIEAEENGIIGSTSFGTNEKKQSAEIHRFPVVGVEVDAIIAKFWAVINDLPDHTSVSSIISALAITQFDVTEALRKKE